MSLGNSRERHSQQEFLRICVVGGMGFPVGAGVLRLCLQLQGADAVVLPLISLSVAVVMMIECSRR